MRRKHALLLLMVASAALAAGLPRSTAPAEARAYIISPLDGATVSSPVTVQFGLHGMGIAPAGIEMANTGHHHLLIDVGLPPMDQPVPADERHLHFGKGQTETTINLAPGKHRLQLLLADHLHLPHEPAIVSEPVTITVR
ncbi:MAG: DUF4399 domain-containing protein [Gammaproteobacteria bacterium]|nr:DUF4399 domain-containing protein [Gammaproteobacteria bacterium]